MLTWQRGRQLVTARRADKEGSLLDFIAQVRESDVPRVPGTAVFPHPNNQTTPLALRTNVAYNHVLHDHIVIMTGRTANVPSIHLRVGDVVTVREGSRGIEPIERSQEMLNNRPLPGWLESAGELSAKVAALSAKPTPP